jgi:hypothetical protein
VDGGGQHARSRPSAHLVERQHRRQDDKELVHHGSRGAVAQERVHTSELRGARHIRRARPTRGDTVAPFCMALGDEAVC